MRALHEVIFNSKNLQARHTSAGWYLGKQHVNPCTRMLAGSYYGQTIQIWAALVAASAVAASLVYGVGGIERAVNARMGARA